MAIISNLVVRMSSDVGPLMAGLAEGQTAIEKFTSSGGSSKGGSVTEGIGGDVALLGAQLQSSMASAMSPLNGFANRFQSQFVQIANTVTETSRRVAAAIRVMGGESLTRMFSGRMADPESFGNKVQVNAKTFNDVINRTNRQQVAVRSLKGEMEGMAKAEAGINAAGFQKSLDAMTKALNLVNLSFETATASIDRMGVAAEAAMRRVVGLMQAAARGKTPNAATTPQVFTPAKAERADRSVKEVATATKAAATEAGAVDRFFTHVNETLSKQINLVDQARKKTSQAAQASSAWSEKFKIDKNFAAFLSNKDVGKPLKDLGPSLSTAVGPTTIISREFRTFAPVVNRASTAVKGLGVQIGMALGVFGLVFKGTQALASFFVGGIKGASDLNETLSKTQVIFGTAADQVIGKADELSAKFGTSKDEYINAASNFGAVFKGIGKSQEEAAGLGNQLAQLGLDMASFDNSSNAQAFTAISAALRGEFDPIEKYRVFLTATKIEQEALNMGLAKTKSGLDDNAKKTATLALIMRQTRDAQGDLARTADSSANQFRKAGGGLENFGVSVGQIFLPAVQAGTVAFNELLASAIEMFESSRPMFESWGAGLTRVMEAVGFAIRNFGDIWEIAKLQVQEKIINILEWFGVLPQNLAIIGEWIGNNWSNMIIDAVNAVSNVFQNLGTNIGKLWEGIQSFLRGEGFNVEFTPLLEGFKATTAELPKILDPALTSLQPQIDAALGRIADREAKRAQEVAKATASGAAGVGGATAGANAGEIKTQEYQGVAALEIGSRESFSAIARNRFGGSADDKPIKSVEKTTKEQLAEQRTQTATLKEILARTGQPLSAFTL